MKNNRGFIVIAVLWILAALSALVVVYLGFVTSSAAVVAVGADRVRSEALINGAVELAAFQLTAKRPEQRPSSGTFNARIGSGQVNVTFRSEAARVNLNGASKALLVGLFISVGAQPVDAVSYADRVMAWRSPAEDAENDPENSAYRIAGLSYLPRHAAFPTPEELWLVQGIPAQFVERVMPLATTFSDLAGVNVADAAPQVIAALPGVTPEIVQAVLAQRADPRVDPRTVLALVGESGAATLEAAKAYRLSIAAGLDNGQRADAEIVILLLESGDEPYRVVSWRNAHHGAAQRSPTR